MKGFLIVCLASLICLNDASLLRQEGGENEVENGHGPRAVNLRSNEEMTILNAADQTLAAVRCAELQKAEIKNQLEALGGEATAENLKSLHQKALEALKGAQERKQADLTVQKEAELGEINDKITQAARDTEELNVEKEEMEGHVTQLRQRSGDLTTAIDELQLDVEDSQSFSDDVKAGIEMSEEKLAQLKGHMEACAAAKVVSEENQQLDIDLGELNVELAKVKAHGAETKTEHTKDRLKLAKLAKTKLIASKVVQLHAIAKTRKEAFGCAQLASKGLTKEKDTCWEQWAFHMENKARADIAMLGMQCGVSTRKQIMDEQGQCLRKQMTHNLHGLVEIAAGDGVDGKSLLDVVTDDSAEDNGKLNTKLQGMCSNLGTVMTDLKSKFEKFSEETETAKEQAEQEGQAVLEQLQEDFFEQTKKLNEELENAHSLLESAQTLLETSTADRAELVEEVKSKELIAAQKEEAYGAAEEELEELIGQEMDLGQTLEDAHLDVKKAMKANPGVCNDSKEETEAAMKSLEDNIEANTKEMEKLTAEHASVKEKNAKLMADREGFKADLSKFSTVVRRIAFDRNKAHKLIMRLVDMKKEQMKWDKRCRLRRDLDCDKFMNGDSGMTVTKTETEGEKSEDTTTEVSRSRGKRTRVQRAGVRSRS